MYNGQPTLRKKITEKALPNLCPPPIYVRCHPLFHDVLPNLLDMPEQNVSILLLTSSQIQTNFFVMKFFEFEKKHDASVRLNKEVSLILRLVYKNDMWVVM